MGKNYCFSDLLIWSNLLYVSLEIGFKKCILQNYPLLVFENSQMFIWFFSSFNIPIVFVKNSSLGEQSEVLEINILVGLWG